MDRFIDGIELLAAAFVASSPPSNLHFGCCCAISLFNFSIPRQLRFRQAAPRHPDLLGIAATSYRGTHITVDLVWAAAGPSPQARDRHLRHAVLLFVVAVQTTMLFDKVRTTRADNVLTSTCTSRPGPSPSSPGSATSRRCC